MGSINSTTILKILRTVTNYPNRNIRKVTSLAHLSYSYTHKVIRDLVKEGMLDVQSNNRERLLSITTKGISLHTHLRMAHELFSFRVV